VDIMSEDKKIYILRDKKVKRTRLTLQKLNKRIRKIEKEFFKDLEDEK